MTTTTLYFGDLRTGRVTDALDPTGLSWAQVLNTAGSVDGITIEGHEVRRKRLRQECQAGRTFLAVDVDGVLQEAGPLWSRGWDRPQLTLGAAGLWSLFDHRMVMPVLAAGQRVQSVSTIVSGTDLGGIARALVAQAMTHVGGNLPLVLPPGRVGDRTETFYGYELPNLGDELRQLTKRQVNAPDIRFRPRWVTGAARLQVEWVMEVGTETSPLLTQIGDDWYFDASVTRGPVEKITTDEDGTIMGSRGWVTGNGMEQDILIGSNYDPALVNAGWPLLELEESRATVVEQTTVDQYAAALVDRSSRPVETWTVHVRAEKARDVLAGDYCRVIPHPSDEWLGEQGETFMRVMKKAGGLGDTVALTMYDVAGTVF